MATSLAPNYSDISMSNTNLTPQTANPLARDEDYTPLKLDPAPQGAPPKPPSIALNATPFSTEYSSPLIQQEEYQHLNLKRLNCSYLSTPGIAPSRTELILHAQSILVFLSQTMVSTKNTVINVKNADLVLERQSDEATKETWDWLTDVHTPYKGPQNPALKRAYDLPLTALMNTLQDIGSPGHPEVVNRCPLHAAPVQDLQHNGVSLPYATHQALIEHANRGLEMIDHLYSAKGGLLGILPPESEKENRKKAESTLLGQMIVLQQTLVIRLHELERELANALDVIKGEAVVPNQTLRDLGVEGRVGRPVCYPQDKFVLGNAGPDLLDFFDQEFGKQERIDEAVKEVYARDGLMGQALWEKRGGEGFWKGMTFVDVPTRFLRLRNDPLKTIFVIPAHQKHPGVQATVEAERVPTVVSVVKPIWPERISLWEQRNREELERAKRTEMENQDYKKKEEWSKDEKRVLYGDNEKKDGLVRALTKERDLLKKAFENKTNTLTPEQQKFYTDFQNAANAKAESEQLLQQAKLTNELAEAAHAEAEIVKKETEELRRFAQQQQRELADQRKRAYDANMARVTEMDQAVGVNAKESESKLKEVLGGQVKEMQILLEWFRSKKVDVERDLVREEAIERGRTAGQSIVDGLSYVSAF